MESIAITPFIDSINEPINLFENFLKSLGIPSKERILWNLSLTEVLANAILHGSDDLKNDMIHINWKCEANSVSITIADKGTGPHTGLIELPSLPDDLIAETGRGLFIVNSFVDTWLHRKSIDGYSQTLIKLLD